MLTSLGIVHSAAGNAEQLTWRRGRCAETVLLFREFLSAASCRESRQSRVSPPSTSSQDRPASWEPPPKPPCQARRETCFRSRGSQASSSKSDFAGDVPADRRSKRNCFTPDFRSGNWQKAALPMPLGLMTPSPVITTRGSISF